MKTTIGTLSFCRTYQHPVCKGIDFYYEGLLCQSQGEITDVEFEFDPSVKE